MREIKYRAGVILLVLILLVCSCGSKKEKRYSEVVNSIEQKPEDVIFGNDTVSNTIFLYASYNCRYCRYLFKRTFPQLQEKYLDKGLVKVVVKWVDFGEDPNSLYALQAASCIYRYGYYDKFHELLLTNPSVIVSEDFRVLLDDIMTENNEIAECVLFSNSYSYLKANVTEFRANKLSGTPCLVMNKHAYGGFISFEDLEIAMKSEFIF